MADQEVYYGGCDTCELELTIHCIDLGDYIAVTCPNCADHKVLKLKLIAIPRRRSS